MSDEFVYKLTCNAVKCLICGTVLDSKHRHDFQACKCGTFVDGGLDYCRCGGPDLDKIEYLSEGYYVDKNGNRIPDVKIYVVDS